MDKEHIYVYAADTSVLDSKELFAQAYDRVSKQRQEKTDRMVFRKDKQLSLGAELLLQRCLKEYGIVSYELGTAEYGKPYLKEWTVCGQTEKEPVYFNLSHSGERVMCVLSVKEAGCDVEKIKKMEMAVAKRFFTEKEYRQVAAQPDEEARNDMFFRIWTRKESYMKATGLGMHLSPESFEADPEHGVLEYHFKEYDLQDGYRYAACGRGTEFDEAIRFVELF